MMNERRVVVTGCGALSCVGNDVPTFWDALVNGRCGIGPITRFDPALFETPEEKELWAKWQTARKEAKEDLAAARFGAAAKKLASDVAAPLDAFFTNVRIYADDKAVASNRLAILKDISETIRNEIADLSKIVTA